MFVGIQLSSGYGNESSYSHWMEDDEKRLVRFLFQNYSSVIRPVEKKKLPVPVFLGIALTQLIDLVSLRYH